MGGACAILAASRAVHEGKKVKSVITFGVPHVALQGFQQLYRDQGLWERTNNIVTQYDPVVTNIPYFYLRVGEYTVLTESNASRRMWNWASHDLLTYSTLLRESQGNNFAWVSKQFSACVQSVPIKL